MGYVEKDIRSATELEVQRAVGGVLGGMWQFKHGAIICEVELMSDVAQGIVDLRQRDVFFERHGDQTELFGPKRRYLCHAKNFGMSLQFPQV